MRHGEKALYRAFGAVNCAEERHSNNKKGAGRRALALLLAFMLCVSFVPVTASASSSAPYNLHDEFKLTDGAIEIGGEYYAEAGEIGFDWNFTNGTMIEYLRGDTLVICFAESAAGDTAIQEIAITNGETGGNNVPTGYYVLGYFQSINGSFYDYDADSVTVDDNPYIGEKGYEEISGTITVNTPGRYEFYPKTYYAGLANAMGRWDLSNNLSAAGFYASENNSYNDLRYGPNADPIVLNVLGEGSSLPDAGDTVVICNNGTLTGVYGLQGAEPLLYTTGSGFGFRATADDGGAVTGAYYTYHDSNGSTVSSGPCVDVGGYYTVTLPADSNTGTSTPYVEITLLTNDTGVTVETDAQNATVSGIDTATGAYRPGGYVSFTVTPTGENAVADVYATYTYGTDGERSLTVQSAGDGYYFYIPEDFGGAAAPTVTVHVTTASTAKEPTSVSVTLDDTSYMPGDVLTATATVTDLDGTALTDIPGSVVSFTMPDGTIVSGFVDDRGEASATWVVTDEFVKNNTDPDGQGSVTAHFGGTGEYESCDGTSAEAAFVTRTISAGTAAITVDPALKVNSTSTLTLSGSIMAGNTTLTYNNGYTIEWFRSEDGGAWASMGAGDTANGGQISVTPRSTNTNYMAVVRGAGSYIGELSFVISNSPAEDTVDLTDATVSSGIYEGPGFTLTAEFESESDPDISVNGGTAFFYLHPNETSSYIYVGEATVVDGTATLVLASSSLPAGNYSIWVEYSGVPGVFAHLGRSGGGTGF